MKYKVGDKVRIVSEKTGPYWNSEGQMDKWLGKVMTIRKVGSVCYEMKENDGECLGSGWFWYEHMIAGPAVQYPAIVTTTDGVTTTATLREGHKVLKTARAVCGQVDAFDQATGAKVALERLFAVEPEKPKGYSGKVVCVKGCSEYTTKGKVYEVVDGRITYDNGHKMVSQYSCLEDMNAHMVSKFIELVED